MEVKKSAKVDLESKSTTFILLGLAIALLLTLFAFEWTTKKTEVSSLGTVQAQAVEEEIVPITRQDEVKPPPPPPPPAVVEVLNIVDDNVKINDELKIDDTEANDQTIVDVAPTIDSKKETEAEEAQVFFIVEEMPEFPGGELALRKFIANAIKYPVIAQENGIQGKVYITFVVDRDGGISDAKVARGVDPSLDKEAIRVVSTLPKWKPGKQRGKPVRVSYTVPISFVLQ